MKIGDLVHIKTHEIYPITVLGDWRTRLIVNPQSAGLIIAIESDWGEDWYQILFPEGTGWAKHYWIQQAQ